MRPTTKLALGFLAFGLLALAGQALSIESTNTPIVPPNETGEEKLHQQQILDAARLKLGSCTVTATGAEATETATCNGAVGAVTMSANMTKVSGAIDLITVTNNKITAGDYVQCTLDTTGAAAAAAAFCSGVQVSQNQVIIQLTNASATSPAATLKVYFSVTTQGNPN